MIYALSITGPTASGKTSLSLSLAKELDGEIISCDSMQIYRMMDIGTAKATAEERAEVPHHMIDIVSPREQYSAEDYRRDALRVAGEITSCGRLPIFVGGTGLYIDTLMRGTQASPPSSSLLRDKLMSEGESDAGRERLWQRLLACDPASAASIHKNNLRRVVRALEIFELSGKPKSYFDELSRSAAPDICVGMITLDFRNRENLYSRVNERVDEMIATGLVCEVRSLYEAGMLEPEYTASQAIGYKELIPYIKGEISLGEATELLKLSSRRYAKRQLTWFRHESDAIRLFLDNEDGRMKESGLLMEEALSAAHLLIEKSGWRRDEI